MTVRKIKIIDDDKVRNEINKLYEKQEQIILAKWSLEMAKHIIKITNFDIMKYPEMQEGFNMNELWQKGKARMYDIRQIGFKIHKVARGHMREHSMVASNYSIKVINILYNNDIEKIKKERICQLEKLKELVKS